mmetsp:Transcript_43584/g.48481  ORF Transcript_43584/g.48481 Transcript_43584/m.48481 type:complete len:138 (+) Transcript_43584:353-766(+)
MTPHMQHPTAGQGEETEEGRKRKRSQLPYTHSPEYVMWIALSCHESILCSMMLLVVCVSSCSFSSSPSCSLPSCSLFLFFAFEFCCVILIIVKVVVKGYSGRNLHAHIHQCSYCYIAIIVVAIGGCHLPLPLHHIPY